MTEGQGNRGNRTTIKNDSQEGLGYCFPLTTTRIHQQK
jgi:hypothetical protein